MRKSIRFRWKRWLLLCVGLLVMAFGVAFSIKGGLGTSPISSLPYVISRITPLTVGTATIAMHVALILLQILLLRRRYQLIQLLQLPVALAVRYADGRHRQRPAGRRAGVISRPMGPVPYGHCAGGYRRQHGGHRQCGGAGRRGNGAGGVPGVPGEVCRREGGLRCNAGACWPPRCRSCFWAIWRASVRERSWRPSASAWW